MIIKKLTLYLLLFSAISILISCSSDSTEEDASADDEPETVPVYRQLAGTSAVGRPASWAYVCLDETCVRADAEGRYLMTLEVAAANLVWAEIPQGDGTASLLYSRYRHSDDLTSSVVNINPSTHAILDIWSNYSRDL